MKCSSNFTSSPYINKLRSHSKTHAMYMSLCQNFSPFQNIFSICLLDVLFRISYQKYVISELKNDILGT